jgi:hypothetical protein
MKWSIPHLGQERVRRVFAWLPTDCEDGKAVWLELYTVVEEWRATRHGQAWTVVGRYAD